MLILADELGLWRLENGLHPFNDVLDHLSVLALILKPRLKKLSSYRILLNRLFEYLDAAKNPVSLRNTLLHEFF